MFPRPEKLFAPLAILWLSGCASITPVEDRLSPGESRAVSAWREGRYAESSSLFMDEGRRLSQPGLASDASAAARHGGLVQEAGLFREAARSMKPGGGTRWDMLEASRISLAAGRPSQALQQIDQPATGWEHLTAGQALRRLGRHMAAVAEFEAAKAADPGLALADQERGETYEALGQNPEAIRAYEAALSSDRTQVHLQLRLARLEGATGKTRSAFDRYTKYLVMDPSNTVAAAGKAELLKADAKLKEVETREDQDREVSWAGFKVRTAEPLPPSPLSPIAVGIVPEAVSFRIKSTSGFTMVSDGKPIGTTGPGEEVSGEAEEGRLYLKWSASGTGVRGTIRFIPLAADSCFALFRVHVAPGYFWSEMETRSYRGEIEVRRDGTKLAVINRVPLEEYLLSCVPAEMPASWPIEALKAQAVAARSETLSKLGRHRSEGYDICSEQHCAVYRGIGNEQKNPSRAVTETRGEILSAGGKVVGAVYADNCGGWGSRPEEVWGSPMRGLKAVCDLRNGGCGEWERLSVSPDTRDRFVFERPDSWCRQPDRPASAYRWTRSYLASELSLVVNRKYKVGKLRRIAILSHTREGRVINIEVEGEDGKQVIKRDSIRSALGGLRSNLFTVEMLPAPGDRENQFIFIGGGWGHGVGLCQTGARGLALDGKKYRDILAHYYPGATRKNLY
jgi:SpoIID/LytB domain protein